MSIDTASKRFRMMNFCNQKTFIVGPVPDGTVDRPFYLHQYFDAAAASTPGTRRHRKVPGSTRTKAKC